MLSVYELSNGDQNVAIVDIDIDNLICTLKFVDNLEFAGLYSFADALSQWVVGAKYCFATMSDSFVIEGTVDKLGHINWSATVRLRYKVVGEVCFKFISDQTYIPIIVRDITNIKNEFPLNAASKT